MFGMCVYNLGGRVTVRLHSLLGVLCIHFQNCDQKVGSPSWRQVPRGHECVAEHCPTGMADALASLACTCNSRRMALAEMDRHGKTCSLESA